MAQQRIRTTVLLLAGDARQAHDWMRKHPHETARYVTGLKDVIGRSVDHMCYQIVGTFWQRPDCWKAIWTVKERRIKQRGVEPTREH